MSRKDDALPDAAALAARLQQQRDADGVRRADELERLRAEAGHDRDRADLATEVKLAELERAEREAAAQAAARLGRLFREAKEAGERTRISSALARSGEARALRLERLRVLNLKVLVPVLLGLAAWSTTGVQAGAARLMRVDAGDPMWWVVWVLEPVLIGAVVWVIVARARLAASGGRMDAGAERIAAGCLTTSIMLNLISAIPSGDEGPSGWAVVGSMIAHAIGPVGAAATAHLIGLVDRSISEADPWTEVKTDPQTGERTRERVPVLADLDLQPPAPVLSVPQTPPEDVPDGYAKWEHIEPGPADAEEWVTVQGRVTAEQVAAFLAGQDPPDGGVTSTPATPDVDGPEGAAATPDDGSHRIDADQPEQDPADDGADRVAPAVAARRQMGLSTRQRIAEYRADHPDATPRQIADAVGVSPTTVRRHLADLDHQ